MTFETIHLSRNDLTTFNFHGGKTSNSVKAEKRAADAGDEAAISKRKLKKMEKNPNRKFPHARANCKICQNCPNPAGQVRKSELMISLSAK